MSPRKIFYGLTLASLGVLAAAFITALAGKESFQAASMQEVSSADQFRQKMQKDSGKVRLIALLSPVCPACRKGFADMQSVLKSVPDERLRVHIVWLPMFPGDSKSWAQTRSDEFKDARLSYYWDGERVTGEDWRNVLGLDRTAWDVYFIYSSNSEWNKSTPTPSFWMHQLGGVTKAPQLNKAELETKVKELLASTK